MFARALAACLTAAACVTLIAAAPSPAPQPTRVDLTKIQPKSLLPKVPLHTAFVVETNKLGQVTRVRSGNLSKDQTFNMQTYGNALQAFIRTVDGKAVAGTYRLTYDYSPKTTRIRRDVALVKAGGVDENAQGAALKMMDIARKTKPETAPVPSPHPVASVNNSRLPDLTGIMHSPAPAH